MLDYSDSYFEIGFDVTIGAPVFWRSVGGSIEIVHAFNTTARVPEPGEIVWIADIPVSLFWRLWAAARKEYGNGCV